MIIDSANVSSRFFNLFDLIPTMQFVLNYLFSHLSTIQLKQPFSSTVIFCTHSLAYSYKSARMISVLAISLASSSTTLPLTATLNTENRYIYITEIESSKEKYFMYGTYSDGGLFVCADALRPSRQVFSHTAGTVSCLPGLNQC